MTQVGDSQPAIATSAGPAPAIAIVDGRLAADVPCIRCKYNLRSLAPAGHCPECGAPIDASIRSGLLRYADPEWVARLASGATWLLASVVIPVAWIWFFQPFQGWESKSTIAPFLVSFFALLCRAVAYAHLTAADPGASRSDSWAKSTFQLCVAASVLGLISDLRTLFPSQPPYSQTSNWFLQHFVIAGIADVIAVCFTAVLAHRLAKRIPSRIVAINAIWLPLIQASITIINLHQLFLKWTTTNRWNRYVPVISYTAEHLSDFFHANLVALLFFLVAGLTLWYSRRHFSFWTTRTIALLQCIAVVTHGGLFTYILWRFAEFEFGPIKNPLEALSLTFVAILALAHFRWILTKAAREARQNWEEWIKTQPAVQSGQSSGPNVDIV